MRNPPSHKSSRCKLFQSRNRIAPVGERVPALLVLGGLTSRVYGVTSGRRRLEVAYAIIADPRWWRLASMTGWRGEGVCGVGKERKKQGYGMEQWYGWCTLACGGTWVPPKHGTIGKEPGK